MLPILSEDGCAALAARTSSVDFGDPVTSIEPSRPTGDGGKR
jgi:hypothetical protein